jgi:hypothetical protein
VGELVRDGEATPGRAQERRIGHYEAPRLAPQFAGEGQRLRLEADDAQRTAKRLEVGGRARDAL